MRSTLGVLALALLVAGACASSPADPDGGREPRGASLGETFPLAFGESAAVDALLIRFASIEDSRCPVEVQCVWEGEGVVGLSVTPEGGAARSVTLHTHPDSAAVAEVDGRAIRLVALDPYPVADRPTPREEYVVTLLVERPTQPLR